MFLLLIKPAQKKKDINDKRILKMEGVLFTESNIVSKDENNLVDESCTLELDIQDTRKQLRVTLNTKKKSIDFPINASFVLFFEMENFYISWNYRGENFEFYVKTSNPQEFNVMYDVFQLSVTCKIKTEDKTHIDEIDLEKTTEKPLVPNIEEITISDDEDEEPVLLQNDTSFKGSNTAKVSVAELDTKANRKKDQHTEKDDTVRTTKKEELDIVASLNKRFDSLTCQSEEIFTDVKVYIYDSITSKEMLQTNKGTVKFEQFQQKDHWLKILDNKDNSLAKTDCNPDICPEFNIQKLSFKFKYFLELNVFIKYILVFRDSLTFTNFKTTYFTHQSENSKIANSKSSFNISTINNDDSIDASESDSEEFEEANDDIDEFSSILDSFYGKSSKTKSLTVGTNNNRSYIVHENNISVIKNDDYEDHLDYIDTFKNLTFNDSKSFLPSKPMMYLQDQAMIFQNENDPTNLYKMDLNKGKIVEEWYMGDNPVVNYAPEKKYDQQELEPTFLGFSNKSIFKVDPRLSSKSKIVQDATFEYKTNPNMNSLATSKDGYVALGSANGNVRLYDKLGKKAKTLINGFGDAINHIVVSNDGRWLLATCSDNLILYDLLISKGKNNEGSLGFNKSNANADYYFLKLPEHIEFAIKQYSKNATIKFSKAYFNSGRDTKESTIVTSAGPYVLSWKLSNILKGRKEPTVIKSFSYNNSVLEDNFVYGSNDKVIVALDRGVTLATPRH